jgi:hypothetical protein
MTVTLADFVFAVRPTVAETDIINSNAKTGSSGVSAGVFSGWSAYLAFPQPASIASLGNIYTVVVVMDPVSSGSWRALLSIPAYASGGHSSPYHSLLFGQTGTSATAGVHAFRDTAASLQLTYSNTGFINPSSDPTSCYAVRRNGASLEFVRNGTVFQSMSTVGGTSALTPVSGADVTIGSRSRTSPGEGMEGTYYFVGIANRVLTDVELAAIQANPLSFESSTVTGTIARTLPKPTLSATGVEVFTGTIARTLPTPVATASAIEVFTGTIARTLSGPTLAASGVEVFTGTIARTLPAPTVVISATEVVTGLISRTLPSPTVNVVGSEVITGTVVGTLPPPTSNVVGSEVITGTVAQTLPVPTLAASGQEIVVGDIVRTLSSPVVTISATEVFTGVISQTLPVPTLVAIGTGSDTTIGTISGVLPVPTIVASGTVGISGTIARTLPVPSISATGVEVFTGAISATLPAPTVTVSGSEKFIGIIAGTLPSPTLVASGLEVIRGTIARTLGAVIATIIGTTTSTSRPTQGYVSIAERPSATVTLNESVASNVTLTEQLVAASTITISPETP